MEFKDKSKYFGVLLASIFVAVAIISGYSKMQVIVLGSGLLFTMLVLTNFTRKKILLLMIAILLALNLFNYTDIRLSYPYLRYIRVVLIFITLIVIVATQNRHDLRFHRSNWDVYLLGLWGVVCSFFAIDLADSLLYSLWLLLSYVIIVETVASHHEIDLIVRRLIAIFAFVSGSFVIWSLASRGFGELTSATTQFRGVEGIFGGRTSFGAACTLTFASSLASLQSTKSGSHTRVLCYLALLGSLVGSLVSLCRASWLAVTACVTSYAWIRKKARHTKYALVVIFILALFTTTWFINILPESFTSAIEARIQSTTDEFSVKSPKQYIRWNLWKANLEYTQESPLFGSGPGCSESIFHFIDPLYSSIFLFSPDIGYGPHNSFLQILVETGIAGFGLFIIILIRSAMSIRSWGGSSKTRDAVLLVLVAIVANSFFESYAFLPGGLLFWPLWTLLIAVRKHNTVNGQEA